MNNCTIYSLYPKPVWRVAAAKAIVRDFPKIIENPSSDWVTYEILMHCTNELRIDGQSFENGAIRFGTGRKRRSSPQGASVKKEEIQIEKKRCIACEKIGLIPSQEFRELIAKASGTPATPENKNIIWNLMKYNGELIQEEFKYIAEGVHGDFLDTFPTFFAPRILYHCLKYYPILYKKVEDVADDHLRALGLLPSLSPSPNSKKIL
ncbi:hypothetical protein QAD02_000730 [Eretmocerus hayati]|uniref:Uncharacterized protein n=1 Tax=Eretmocerus hayati TaxID=131215 RepID=A0ACC2NEE8_9HYME|nr:hypothetical protein QAD02_000730 [Eretmocerus hayati]